MLHCGAAGDLLPGGPLFTPTMLTHLIADASATQPTGWSPEMVTAVIGGLVLLVGAVGSAIASVIVAWRSNTKATAAQAGNEALQHSVNRLSARQNADAATVASTLREMPPTGRGPSPLLLLPLLLIPFVAGCTTTSESYKALVATTYPKVADRLDRYPLTEQEKGEVATLRQVSAKRADVRYETARPAWEAVAPDYRRYVSEDSGEHLLPGKPAPDQERRRSDWLKTADILDEAQAAEAENHKGLLGN